MYLGGPMTGASMNPARSHGRAVFTVGDALSLQWFYMRARMVGGVAMALLFKNDFRKMK